MNCPICDKPMVDFYKEDSPILVVEGLPDKSKSLLFNVESRELILKEMFNAGFNHRRVGFVTALSHMPGERRSNAGKELNAQCEKVAWARLANVLKGKGAILLGADAVRILSSEVYKISEVSGLELDIPNLEYDTMIACMSPGKTIGETVLALTNAYRKMGHLQE